MSSADEQRLINGLFDRIKQAEQQTGERDAEAARLIKERLDAQPAAPYYMAQTIIIQESALERLNERVETLEKSLEQAKSERSSGGFLAGLFGGAAPQRNAAQAAPSPRAQRGSAQPQPGWGANNAQPQPQGGGRSFLSGALQTAAGVAGGVVLGNMLMNMFSGHSGEEIVNEGASNLDTAAQDAGFDQGADQGYDDGMQSAGFDDQGIDDGMQDAGYDDGGGFDDFNDDEFI